MSLEQKVNYQLNKYPHIKKIIKRIYQVGLYTISPKIKSQGNIIRVSPCDEYEYFFGYYDKSPWDITGRFMLCMRAKETFKEVSPSTPADLLIIDTADRYCPKKIGVSHSWNVQQGCMLQWLGPDFADKVIYNDFRDGRYCSIILSVSTGKERVICQPVYSVSQDGRFALTLDFSRLHRLRKGYGYSNMDDKTKNDKLPAKTCIWKVDLVTGESFPLLKYTDFASFEARQDMRGAEHKVNHLMISPSGERFMVLHRWLKGQRKYTRLVTCNCDGTEMYNLSDDDMVSHCCWKDNSTILAFENKRKTGPGYYLMKDKSPEYTHLWSQLSNDGHPSYSPDRKYVVIDTYPDRARMAEIKVLDEGELNTEERVIARVFAPFKYDNDVRCDLHPRWSRDGKAICFDAVFEGKRRLYIVENKIFKSSI